MIQQAETAKQESRPFLLNKSAIARDVPCTRKTLDAHEQTINDIFTELFPQAARLNRDGSIELEKMRKKLHNTESKAERLEQENKALVEMHTNLFDKLTLAGVHPSIFADLKLSDNVVSFPDDRD